MLKKGNRFVSVDAGLHICDFFRSEARNESKLNLQRSKHLFGEFNVCKAQHVKCLPDLLKRGKVKSQMPFVGIENN